MIACPSPIATAAPQQDATAAAESSSSTSLGHRAEPPPASSKVPERGEGGEEDPELPLEPAAISRRARGRTTRFSGRLAAKIVYLVRTHGISSSRAGLIAGVPTSTLHRWQHEDPDLADDLEAARVFYELPYIQQIASGMKRDGSKDWRAAAWFLERTNSELYARPTARHHANSHCPNCDRKEISVARPATLSRANTPSAIPANRPETPRIIPENHNCADADQVLHADPDCAEANGLAHADPQPASKPNANSAVPESTPSSPITVPVACATTAQKPDLFPKFGGFLRIPYLRPHHYVPPQPVQAAQAP